MKRQLPQIVVTRQPVGNVGCLGIAFVGDLRLPPLDMSGSVLPGTPKISFSNLDLSFATNSYRHLANTKTDTRTAVRRYTRSYSQPVPRLDFHLYFFSEHFCQLLATIDKEMASSISRNWYAREKLSVIPLSEDQVRTRTDMLFALSQIAQIALDQQKSLFLKVEYFRQLNEVPPIGHA